jgi:hypothetical protein
MTHRSRASWSECFALNGKGMATRTPYIHRVHAQHRVALQGLWSVATTHEEGRS